MIEALQGLKRNCPVDPDLVEIRSNHETGLACFRMRNKSFDHVQVSRTALHPRWVTLRNQALLRFIPSGEKPDVMTEGRARSAYGILAAMYFWLLAKRVDSRSGVVQAWRP